MPGDEFLGEALSPASPLQTVSALLAEVGSQIAKAELVASGSPLAALDALKHLEKKVGMVRKLLAAQILGEAPKGAKRVLLHMRRP